VILGLMRIKNEGRWIHAVVSAVLPVCDGMLILDDHSTDDTRAICASFGDRVSVLESPFQGLNESRDKNYLLEQARSLRPDWCVLIDGDEVMEPAGPERIRAELDRGPHSVYSLRIRFLWNSPVTVRVDGVYGSFRRPSIFRYHEGACFQVTPWGGQFHCGSVPQNVTGTRGEIEADLYHLGYMSREDRLRKYQWYNASDPGNESEDCYRHVVQGDIPEVPAYLKLKHAGPLVLTRF
jgi:glycosyltransferase involved in cell wall biosynthesis